MPRDFIVDTDTASDDAVALLMALRHPDVRVTAITTVAGNVELEQATRNALYAVELSGTDVPVYRGADRPLHRELAIHAPFFPTWMTCSKRRSAPSRRQLPAA